MTSRYVGATASFEQTNDQTHSRFLVMASVCVCVFLPALLFLGAILAKMVAGFFCCSRRPVPFFLQSAFSWFPKQDTSPEAKHTQVIQRAKGSQRKMGGAAISVFEGGSCSNVEAGQNAGALDVYGLPVFPDSNLVCLRSEFLLRGAFEGTNLSTDIFPDLATVGDSLVIFPSRDGSCSTQPRTAKNPFRIVETSRLDQSYCQDVENGFVLYCYDDNSGGGLPRRDPCFKEQRIEQALNQILLLDDDEDTSFNTTSS